VTFRARLVIAATGAVVVVVLLGALVTYIVASNSLLGSADATLNAEANAVLSFRGVQPQTIPNVCGAPVGTCYQIVAPGEPMSEESLVLPITSAVRTSASSHGRAPEHFTSTTDGAVAVREIVVALPPHFTFIDGFDSPTTLSDGGALQLTVPLTGVNLELRHLAFALWLIVISGVLLAVLLGFGVGRTVLRPLDDLTQTVEGLADTTDVSQRLDPGGPDELGRLRRAFNRLLAAVDSSRESQRQLVLDASHELRTPLTSLRTNMEVARRLDELAPEERDVLIGDVLTQMDELTTLVGDLAELARGDQPNLVTELVRLDSIVLEAVEVATTHGRSRGVRFETMTHPTWVLGSSARIVRAVDNLLDNALKWSPDGQVVEVACSRGTVFVRDHGPGIDPADLPFIFDRFYRAPNARSKAGSGLGLAIVAQVAADEGGSVEAYPAEGGGALFRFSLPDVPAPSDPDQGLE
jgi:two-component system sensor histidine kinase MprB